VKLRVSADEHLNELAGRFDRWLIDPTLDDAVPAEILALSPKQRQAFCAAYPAEQRRSITQALIDRAYLLQERSPGDSVPVARAAVSFAKSITGTTDGELAKALELEADAWREHARSLLMIGEYDDARRSADEAAFNYSVSINDGEVTQQPLAGQVLAEFDKAIATGIRISDSRIEVLEKATRLGLVLGQIIHCQGQTDEGLSMMARSCEMLLYCFDDREMYVKGRITYAKVLAEAKRFTEALEVFQSTATLAKELDDREVQAHLVNNIGVCYYYLGNFEKAKPCAETAMAIFESMALPIDAIRPRTLLVILLMEQAKANKTMYSAAAAELFKTRAAWLAAGMKRDAAEVMVYIIRALILADRQAHINWAEMNRTFREAGLGHAAMRALQHLEATHALRPLTLEDVEDANSIIAHLNRSGTDVAKAG
jgi:tetratricopeptide (TPR) repeat protein